MIAFPKPQPTPAWHHSFQALLPSLLHHAKHALRTLPAEAREDALQEVIVNCLVAFLRLNELGKENLVYASVLVRYAVKHFYAGRRVGNRWRKHDLYIQTEAKRQQIGSPREQRGGWREQLVENSVTPVPQQAAFRIDFPEWLSQLSDRDQQIAEALAKGERTQDVASQFDISSSRVSQLRRELAESWAEFHWGKRDSAAVELHKEVLACTA